MYYSCQYLEEGINFDMDAIMPCCPGSKYSPPSIHYAGGEFPLDDMLHMYEESKILNQTSQAPCKGCPLLRYSKWPQFSGKYRLITFNHFRQCNSKCSYCDAWYPKNREKNKPRYRLSETIQSMINANLFHPDAQFFWGGGEPTILEEFERLFVTVNNGGYHQTINTNAIVFSQALASGFKGGLIKLQISLDSGTPETYKRIKGLDIHKKVIDNIRSYAISHGGSNYITLKYIMKNDNCSKRDINNFIALCKDFGISTTALSPEASDAWSGKISSEAISSGIYFIDKCRMAGISVTILEDLYGPEYSHQIYSGLKRVPHIIFLTKQKIRKYKQILEYALGNPMKR